MSQKKIDRMIRVDIDEYADLAVIRLDPWSDADGEPFHGVHVVDESGNSLAVLTFNRSGALCEIELFDQSVTLPPRFRE